MFGSLSILVRRLFAPSFSPGESCAAERLFLIDALRGIASFAILLWHYQHFYMPVGTRVVPVAAREEQPFYTLFMPVYEHGHHAVSFFWLISGFVFAQVYYQSQITTRQFFLSRFARLYPLHFLTLIVVAVLQAIAEHRFGASLIYGSNDFYHFLLNLLFASAWGLERSYSFNAPIWSVSVEILVYAIFWFGLRWLPRFGVLLPLLAVMAARLLAKVTGESSFLLCLTFFFSGVALLSTYRVVASSRALVCILALLLASWSGALAWLLPPGSGVIWILLSGFSALLMLSLLLDEYLSLRGQRFCELIGDNTYGMYLWHFPFQLLLFLVFATNGSIAELASSPWFFAGYLVVIVGFARFGFITFERPMRQRLRFGTSVSAYGAGPGAIRGDKPVAGD